VNGSASLSRLKLAICSKNSNIADPKTKTAVLGNLFDNEPS